jgi:hypothetical protein
LGVQANAFGNHRKFWVWNPVVLRRLYC